MFTPICLKKICVLMVIIVLSLMTIECRSFVFAYDRVDIISDRQSAIFGPSAINVTKRRTDSIISQLRPAKKPLPIAIVSGIVDFILGKKDENEVNSSVVTPELKHKTSRSGEPLAASAIMAMAAYNVNIGSGTDQYRDPSTGRLLYETINGTRHVYIGFSDAGYSTITEAMNNSNSGDILIVRSGTYSTETFTWDLNGTMMVTQGISLKNGIKLYGGYDEYGQQSFGETTIEGSVYAEDTTAETILNGFTIDITTVFTIRMEDGEMSLGAGFYGDNASNIKLYNNTFRSGDNIPILTLTSAVNADRSNIELRNNVFDTFFGITAYGGSKVNSMDNNFNGVYGIGKPIYVSGDETKVDSGGDYLIGNPEDGVLKFENGEATISNPRNDPNTDRASLVPPTSLTNYNPMLDSLETNRSLDEKMSNALEIDLKDGSVLDMDMLPSLLSGLIKEKNNMLSKKGGEIDPALLVKLAAETLGEFSLAVPLSLSEPGNPNTEAALLLAKIIKDPTEDQKKMLDVIESLMIDVNKVREETGSSEIQKASDDLLKVLTAALIAQALPDLLKEGDVAAIKGMFSELNIAKAKVILEYQEGIKPYYEEIIKQIAKNLAILQLKGLVTAGLTEKELRRMKSDELNGILDKIRKSQNKSFEEEYILQQEAKYRKKYLDPSKNKLEEGMKKMLKTYTAKMYAILGNANVIREKQKKR